MRGADPAGEVRVNAVVDVTGRAWLGGVAQPSMSLTMRSPGARGLRRFAQDLAAPVQNWVANERARTFAYRDEVWSNLGCLPDD